MERGISLVYARVGRMHREMAFEISGLLDFVPYSSGS